MHVTVVSLYAFCTPHYAIDLEIIEDHIARGDTVQMIGCDASLHSCDINPTHSFSRCLHCTQRKKAGVRLLSQVIQVRPLVLLSNKDRATLASLPSSFSTHDELGAYRVHNFDIGEAVLSSISSMTRDPYFDLRSNGALIQNLLIASYTVYLSIQNYLAQHQVDRVYCFNGRLAPLRAVLRACQRHGVECVTHEVGHDLNYYALYPNTLPHDLDYLESQIRSCWREAAVKADQPDREAIASRFFEARAKGAEIAGISFVRNQRPELLPSSWSQQERKRKVMIFGSSEDEFIGLGKEWRNPLYSEQLAGMQDIVTRLARYGADTHIYFRMHPNLSDVRNPYTQRLRALRADHLTVIQPEDPVSSYELLRRADTVVTFGSTMGIEAVYWGKPSVLAGRSLYANLGGTYNASSREELGSLLTQDLPPLNRVAALSYGYYFSTFGIRSRLYEPKNRSEGLFKGKSLDVPPWVWRTLFVLRRVWPVGLLVDRLHVAISRKRVTGRFLP